MPAPPIGGGASRIRFFMQRWPQTLWIVRHGESAGNVAREEADRAGLHRIDIPHRDVDVRLSPLGEEQSAALGAWFARLPEEERPEVIVCSPYARARQTAEIILREGGVVGDEPIIYDERLREKEFGILDRLTTAGIRALYPEQAAFRGILGKFYHRPPGGESWCDVILRLRSASDTISLHYEGRRVLIVAHQVVVFCMRYLLENLDEGKILAIDREGDIANCGVTEYRLEPHQRLGGRLRLERFNFTAPLRQAGAPVTRAPDAKVAAR
ncbi:MAG TPA: histidine phosphatase family protein [Mesorhizobium sp.]|jgi:broad specificity phosphatase PhoE|nr:histidine phosphatase family protein [Mesorhizobium sp.]